MDFVRGVATIMMITFHFMFDLNFFHIKTFNFDSIGLKIFRLSIPILFLILVGMSLTISYSRVRELPKKKRFLKYLKRGSKIFSYGMLITVSTFMFLKEGTIIFGILHLIGLSIILAYPFLGFKYLNLFLGFSIIVLTPLINGIESNSYFLLPFGIYPSTFYSLDYFPIFSWFGIVLIGIYLGNQLYPNGKRRINVFEIKHFLIDFIKTLGRNSLVIYLIHQPVIILGLILSGLPIAF